MFRYFVSTTFSRHDSVLQPQDEQCRSAEYHPYHQVNDLHVSFHTFRLQACFLYFVLVPRFEYIIVKTVTDKTLFSIVCLVLSF
jgi:hypothetical protein